MKALTHGIALALAAACVAGCGCGQSSEENAEDILVVHGGSKEMVSELAKKGVPHLRKLLASKSSRTRMTAISALGEIKGDAEATELLIQCSQSETDTDVYFALIALANQGASETKELAETFFKHKNPYFRESACVAIGIYGDKALYPLLDKATHDPVISVQNTAFMVKEKYGIRR